MSVEDPSTLLLQPDGGYIPRRLREQVQLPEHTRRKWHRQARELFRPTKNGYNDALSHLFIIDALLRLEPDQWIRANNLRNVMRIEYPQLLWDTVTIGRILGELAEISALEQGVARALLSAGRDRAGTYFILIDSAATYAWLLDLRDKAQDKVNEDLRYLRDGLEPPTRAFSVWGNLSKLAIGGIAASGLVAQMAESPLDGTLLRLFGG